MRWLSEAETQSKWYDTVRDLPAVKGAWETGDLADDQQLQVFGQQLDSALAPPAVPTLGAGRVRRSTATSRRP